MPRVGDAGAGRYAFAALANAAVRVQRAGKGNRHYTIVHEARSLARFVSAGLLTQTDVTGVLRGAGVIAGKPERETDSIIAWAISHPSNAVLPEDLAR
jgi:hypothetical protein